MKNRLTIAIQGKGRLSEESIRVLNKSGITFSTMNRKLLAKAKNYPIDILFVRDDDIPSLVSNGIADMGIVGENVLVEKTIQLKKSSINKVLNLGFSRCKLSFATPAIKKISSLRNKTIATSYPNIVRNYLKENNINAKVVNFHGSVELTPYIGIADCICDLVSSGATLEANNLIEFKTLLESQAVLVINNKLNKSKSLSSKKLIKRIEGVVNAKESKYVMLNANISNVKSICKLLPGSESPTLIPLEDPNKVAIHALCQEPVFWETMEKLKAKGASSILVMPVEKILN